LTAWKQLQRIRREQAALAELPIAALQALTANISRDPKKTKPFTALDFAMYREKPKDDKVLSAEVASVALALRHEDRCPSLLITAWNHVLASAGDGAAVPEVRALHSDDDAVWVLAPKWEGRNCRGGLVLVRGRISGVVRLRDIDRSLAVHDLVIPERPGFGWLEAGLLLVAGNLGEPLTPDSVAKR
jgi:hypothetical protein